MERVFTKLAKDFATTQWMVARITGKTNAECSNELLQVEPHSTSVVK